MYKVCRHIQPDGCCCEAPALKGLPYCYHHDRVNRARLRQRSAPKNKLELPVLEDRRSILEALSHVISALAAGRLIYGLQVAAQYAPHSAALCSYGQVQSVTLITEGDELGTAKFKCDEEEDCQACPYYDECDRKAVTDDEDDDSDKDDEEDGNPKDSSDDSDDEDDDGDDDDSETTQQLIADVEHLQSVRDAFESGDVLPLVRLISE